MNLSNIAILKIHRINYHRFTSGFSKTKGINLLQNNDFTVKNAAHRSEKGEGTKKSTLPKICHTYPTMTKLGTVTPYLKNIRKLY